ncbi:centrosomal protein of 78 kDa-like [Saccoglossus kowalevskii]|uniref:Centrosomal protein of 78 kDa-like n=1 Tax=Saccoglossus kowalevskii TaxID=10224 RepID=A0ABM0MPZ1_SACKO|nr:PREDICTED: centrosomal protein of 78 kDa-like [Saccoglossus kowalevskii]
MIESVQARQRGAYDFGSHYDNLCLLQNTCPLHSVKAHIEEGVLDVNADRIRLSDWTPLLNTLAINKSLQYIGIRSYYQNCDDDKVSESQKYTAKKRAPPIRSKEVTYRLCTALKDCLSVSPALTILELQGLPLRERDLTALSKGISKNKSLNHLSLEYCMIGDQGVQIICQGLKNSVTIHSLNLTGCCMTWKGADTLAKVIKHQATKRHSEAWQDSLRYRRPDLDRMSGLRRLTLNSNSLVNDSGAIAFADGLRDDLWLKALDMQGCGISDVGAKALLDVLKTNSTLVVLDVRKNPLIDRELLKDVMEQVLINSGGEEVEYKWLKMSSPKDPSKRGKSRKKTKTLNSTFGRKTTIRLRSGASKTHGKTVACIRSANRHSGYSPPNVSKPGPGFIPWRTAARASRHRGFPHDREPGELSFEANCETSTPDMSSVVINRTSTPSDMDTEMSTPITSMRLLQHDRDTIDHKDDSRFIIKDMKVELEELRRRLFVESRTRAAADSRIIELEVENSRLKHQIHLMEARGPSSPFRSKPTKSGIGADDFEDDTVLDSIEASFNKFHAFLDLLRDAGLGQLCTLVGLSPEDIMRPGVASILQQYQPQPTHPVLHQPQPIHPVSHQPPPPPPASHQPPPPVAPTEAWIRQPTKEDAATQEKQRNTDTDQVGGKQNNFGKRDDEANVVKAGYEEDGVGNHELARGGLEEEIIDSLQEGLTPQPIVIEEERHQTEQ